MINFERYEIAHDTEPKFPIAVVDYGGHSKADILHIEIKNGEVSVKDISYNYMFDNNEHSIKIPLYEMSWRTFLYCQDFLNSYFHDEGYRIYKQAIIVCKENIVGFVVFGCVK